MSTSFGSVDELNQWLVEHHMGAYWDRRGAASEAARPFIWKGGDIDRGIMSASEMIPMQMTEMRNLGLRNPSMNGRATPVSLGIQSLMPGERTRAHRNLKSETRFVLRAAPGATFIVDGEPIEVEEGDLVTTPNWSWHDHYNGSDQPMVWLDGLDMGLVGLGVEINERYTQGQQVVDRPPGYTAMLAAAARPVGSNGGLLVPPPHHYRWRDTYETLRALKEAELEGDPCDGLHLTYTHPLTGGPTLPTMACEIQLMPPGFRARAHRHNSTTFYHVFRGEGATLADNERIAWSQGDVLMIPPWIWHAHETHSSDDAVLYSITDRPAMQALGLYREESAN
ncbi:MAG: gentisate 1,2-dioxygenase [Chloroflexi bacterium]|nr:gentisate 1,2-dioxygenase [Chloroflexota bacterium]